MPIYIETINKILSMGTIFLQLVIIVLIFNLVFSRSRENKILVFFKNQTFILGFLSALGAVVLSLFYSEIAGFPPCELCWIQRIFLYPQLILFGMELYKKDRSMIDFSLIFASLGSLTSIYHIYVENGGTRGLSCATGIDISGVGEASCAVRYIYEFGYITMPVMALTLSVFIIILLLNYKYVSRVK